MSVRFIQFGRVNVRADPSYIRDVITTAVNEGLNSAAVVAVRAIKSSFSKNGKFKPSPPGSPPNRHNSVLFNGIDFTPAKKLTATVYTSGVAYAYKQEFGGSIFPKTKKYLTVPLNETAARDREVHGTLRSLPLRLGVSKKGNLILFQATRVKGYKGKIKQIGQPMYVLKTRIDLPERPYMRPVFKNRQVLAAMTSAFYKKSRSILARRYV